MFHSPSLLQVLSSSGELFYAHLDYPLLEETVFLYLMFSRSSCHVAGEEQMLDKHLFEVNLISYIFKLYFKMAYVGTVILKRFCVCGTLSNTNFRYHASKEGKTQKNLKHTSRICNLSTEVMTTLSSIWSSPELRGSLGKSVDCFEHALLCTQEAKFCNVPLASHVSEVLACPYTMLLPKQQVLLPLNAAT